MRCSIHVSLPIYLAQVLVSGACVQQVVNCCINPRVGEKEVNTYAMCFGAKQMQAVSE